MTVVVGRVEAVCLSTPNVRVAKTPHDEAFLGPHGFEGDRHAGEQARNYYNGKMSANLRQWTAVANEEVEAMCADLGVEPFPIGALGENLRLSGITLAGLERGAELELASGARLLITGQNDPCINAASALGGIYGPHVEENFVRTAYGRRGVIGSVLEPGLVRVGDEVRLVVPEPEGRQLKLP